MGSYYEYKQNGKILVITNNLRLLLVTALYYLGNINKS